MSPTVWTTENSYSCSHFRQIRVKAKVDRTTVFNVSVFMWGGRCSPIIYLFIFSAALNVYLYIWRGEQTQGLFAVIIFLCDLYVLF